MSRAKPNTVGFNGITLAALILFCVACCLRFSSLGHLPGINADEADMGVRILKMIQGHAYSLRSHTGQFFNPLFVISESCLLKVFPQNFYLLRLPAAIFALLGILVLIYAMGRCFHDWILALVLGTLTACFPEHLMFSRLAWDPTFVLFWTPVLLYLAMRWLASPRQRELWLLAICMPLIIWTHATAVIFVLALLAALFWARRDNTATWARSWLPQQLSKILARNGLVLFAFCTGIAALAAWLGWRHWVNEFPQMVELTPLFALRLIFYPGLVQTHFRLLGDMLTSFRGFNYIAGLPVSGGFAAASWLAEFFLAWCWVRMARGRNAMDRFLAALLIFYLLLIVLTAGFLHLYIPGNQRYLMPLMVLLPIMVVRAFPRPALLLILSAGMLAEYVICFQQPMIQSRYAAGTELTFWTGEQEPKAQAGHLILALAVAVPGSRQPIVYSDMYWLTEPLEFVVFGHAQVLQVAPNWNPQEAQAGDFIASYAGENFGEDMFTKLNLVGRHFETHVVSNPFGLPQIFIIKVLD